MDKTVLDQVKLNVMDLKVDSDPTDYFRAIRDLSTLASDLALHLKEMELEKG